MQLSSSPATIATNLVLSLLLLFLILLACTVFNQTLEENHSALAAVAAGLLLPLRRRRPGSHETTHEDKSASPLQIGLILLIVAAIYSGLDPDFGLNQTTLALVISLTIGVGALTVLYEGSQILFSSRALGVPGRLELRPLGIVIAVVSVLITRVTSLHPGIVLGVIAGAVVPIQDSRQQGRVTFVAMVGTLVLSLLAFLAVGPLRSYSESTSGWFAVVPETVAVTLFVGGIEGLVFNLLPLDFMEGRALWQWSRITWLVFATVVSFIFFHVVVNRTNAYTSVAEETGVQALFAICVVCVLLASAFWLVCRIWLSERSVADEYAES
jgi:hypothetical protein